MKIQVPKIHTAGLDNIFKAMKGVRIFERFEFNLPKQAESEISNRNVVQDYDEWEFSLASFDWLHVRNGDRLAAFNSIWQLIDLLNNHIDTGFKDIPFS